MRWVASRKRRVPSPQSFTSLFRAPELEITLLASGRLIWSKDWPANRGADSSPPNSNRGPRAQLLGAAACRPPQFWRSILGAKAHTATDQRLAVNVHRGDHHLHTLRGAHSVGETYYPLA